MTDAAWVPVTGDKVLVVMNFRNHADRARPFLTAFEYQISRVGRKWAWINFGGARERFDFTSEQGEAEGYPIDGGRWSSPGRVFRNLYHWSRVLERRAAETLLRQNLHLLPKVELGLIQQAVAQMGMKITKPSLQVKEHGSKRS